MTDYDYGVGMATKRAVLNPVLVGKGGRHPINKPRTSLCVDLEGKEEVVSKTNRAVDIGMATRTAVPTPVVVHVCLPQKRQN